MDDTIGKVPIHLKMTLTTKEAAEYSNIGINKISKLPLRPVCRDKEVGEAERVRAVHQSTVGDLSPG